MKLEENKKASEKKMKKERRTFLKRAVYVAPSLVLLGSLVKPVVLNAASPPLPPNNKGFGR